MAKLNITQVMNEIVSEEGSDNLLRLYSPLRGLYDDKGSVTRYPYKIMPSYFFTKAFLDAGGNFDRMGHYGYNPEFIQSLESQRWTEEQVALLGAGVPVKFCQVEGVTPQNWKVYSRGFSRAEMLQENSVEFSCSVWTLGAKKPLNFLKLLLGKINKVQMVYSGHKYTEFLVNGHLGLRLEKSVFLMLKNIRVTLKEALVFEDQVIHTDNLNDSFLYGFVEYLRNCYKKMLAKEARRKKIEEAFASLPEKPNFLFNANLNAKKVCKKENLPTSGREAWYHYSYCGKDFFPQWKETSMGKIAHITPTLLLIYKYGEEPVYINIRVVAGYNVAKIEDIFFVWKGDFKNHLEHKGGLRAAIDRAESRVKRDSLSLCFSDVRNDVSGTAGFCLAGVKAFLQSRMPHVYRLVKSYSSWNQVPQELMEIQWHLKSASIFEGYRSPLS